MRKSNYDKFPATAVNGELIRGWEDILQTLANKRQASDKKQFICVIECYQGTYLEEIESHLRTSAFTHVIKSTNYYKSEASIEAMTHPWLTDDRLFGRLAPLTFRDFFDAKGVETFREKIQQTEEDLLIFGPGAAYLCETPDLIVYIDMARWEIQQRFRRQEIDGLGVHNRQEAPSAHYKRGFFIDWNVCDQLKKQLLSIADYFIDTHVKERPKMISGDLMRKGLEQTAHQPFRVVPFFDPAPWGGQWMKEVCDLDRSKQNFGWCFDCVPEENSLLFKVDGDLFEMAANNLVFAQTRPLLGAPVESRFGQDFPIRFDFLDTMGGGHLSLQVHPTTQYIRDTFGLCYTQDESYYLLDAEEGATVYLGLQTGVNPDEMISALNKAQETGEPFDAERFVNKWPAKKHDHYLIPNGTIHCSGAGAMVLEISATPNLFTFKLYDWGRLGLDGIPRPINIKHGAQVIQWERQTEMIKREFINAIEPIAEGEGWIEERTGLHDNEFIETRRHWFTDTVPHQTGNGVNVFNLIEGEEAIVESPTQAFEPLVVHYAETFIIPAAVGNYTIRPYGQSVGKKCGTIKAFIRFKA